MVGGAQTHRDEEVPLRPILAIAGLVFIATFAAAVELGQAAPAKPSPTTRAVSVPQGVVLDRDVAYLPADREEKADLYLPADRAADVRSPAVLIIHGGGWTGGDKGAAREINIGAASTRWFAAARRSRR